MRITGNPGSGGKKPGTPTIGTATAGDAQATISFTPPTYLGKGGTVTYTATSSPGGLTGTSTSSPITITGLTNGTAYTFTVRATTSYGVSSDSSAASNSVTPAAPFVATGGTVTTPGDGYKYHTFTGGGTFTVTSGSQPAAYVLVVAGGGGGGGNFPSVNVQSAGGGGGGVIYSPVAFTPTGGNGSGVYTVTVGGGGAGVTYTQPNGVRGGAGSNSSFTGITTAIGGGGGGNPVINGGPGGSGGGGVFPTPSPIVGLGTPGQGNPGGSPDWPTTNNTKGGGGAGGQGANEYTFPFSPSPFQANVASGGPAVTYFGIAVGGGGGGMTSKPRSNPNTQLAYVSYGGENAGRGQVNQPAPLPLGGPGYAQSATDGVANRGGGGGGAGSVTDVNGPPGSGGSGIVIVRYPV